MNLFNKLKLKIQLFKNMGFRYTKFRIGHEFKRKIGFYQLKHPVQPKTKKGISLAQWRQQQPKFFYLDREELKFPKMPNPDLKMELGFILSGKIKYFYDKWIDLGLQDDWITHPVTAYKYPLKHWSKIDDFNLENGDIKYVWEKSRFSYLLTVMRYDYHFQEDHSYFVIDQIMSWIENNPINRGPNWKCSQEISLRIINWTFLLYFYKNSSALTEEKWTKIQQVIYWSLHHVYHHINFSRIAVRNNHAITETLMLSVSKMLFPYFTETEKWSKKGRKWLVKEINYQVYDDGTFLQFSMNYQRVLVQLLSFGIALTELHQKPFSKSVYKKAYASLNFLFQSQIEENGQLPNYGHNDGALFFPFSTQEYRDYRPQLSCLYQILTKNKLYKNAYEEEFWIQSNSETPHILFPEIRRQKGLLAFEKGGYYLIRENDTLTFLRCGNHKDRPHQADNLHLDIWEKGVNILRDAGSFQYNGNPQMIRLFSGSIGHNTVTIDRKDQMLKGSRFIWYYWSQREKCVMYETHSEYIIEGKISAFRYLNKKIFHQRIVSKTIGKSDWIVEDKIIGLPKGAEMGQHWHGIHKGLFTIKSKDKAGNTVHPKIETSYYSSHYGRSEEQEMLTFSGTMDYLKTRITSI